MLRPCCLDSKLIRTELLLKQTGEETDVEYLAAASVTVAKQLGVGLIAEAGLEGGFVTVGETSAAAH